MKQPVIAAWFVDDTVVVVVSQSDQAARDANPASYLEKRPAPHGHEETHGGSNRQERRRQQWSVLRFQWEPGPIMAEKSFPCGHRSQNHDDHSEPLSECWVLHQSIRCSA